jgi:hypothetical protein
VGCKRCDHAGRAGTQHDYIEFRGCHHSVPVCCAKAGRNCVPYGNLVSQAEILGDNICHLHAGNPGKVRRMENYTGATPGWIQQAV